MRTALITRPASAYSRMYKAANTPNGTTSSDMISVISTVPKIAGQTPPSVFDSRGSSNRNSCQRSR